MTHSLWCSLLSLLPEDGVIGPLWYLVRTSRTYVGFKESPDSVLEYRGAVLGDTGMLMLPDILGLSLTPYSRPGLEFSPYTGTWVFMKAVSLSKPLTKNLTHQFLRSLVPNIDVAIFFFSVCPG